MEAEEIEDDPGREVNSTTPLPTKKGARAKNNTPAVHPSNTLTRFLEPPGPCPLSAWQDFNRQCPVCQQKGFSSRALELHVNECLDVARETIPARENAVEEGKGGAENAEGWNALAYARTKTEKSAGRAISKADKKARKKGPRSSGETSEKTTVVVDNRKKQHSSDGSAKKSKTHRSPKLVGGSGSCNTARSDTRSLKPRLPNSTLRPSTGTIQPDMTRRRGLLSRPKVLQTVTSVPATTTNSAQKGSEGLARDEIARHQLLYVLEASENVVAQEGIWLGTQLFPRVPGGDFSAGDEPPSESGGNSKFENLCQGEWEDDCGCNKDGRVITGSRNRRVRARPSSWGAPPTSKQQGWLGMWSEIDDGDDCWGDGDGYLTLKPFPSREVADGSELNENGEISAPQIDDLKVTLNCEEAPLSSSRADRFLEVFSRLQPARRALKLKSTVMVPPTIGMAECLPPRTTADRIAKTISPKTHRLDAPGVDVVTGNTAVGSGMGKYEAPLDSRDCLNAGEWDTPSSKGPTFDLESPVASVDGKTRKMSTEADDDNLKWRDGRRENSCTIVILNEDASPGLVDLPKPSVRHDSGSEPSAKDSPKYEDHHQSTERPVEFREPTEENRINKVRGDAIDITPESSSSPERSSPETNDVYIVDMVKNGALHISTRSNGTSRTAEAPAKEISRSKEGVICAPLKQTTGDAPTQGNRNPSTRRSPLVVTGAPAAATSPTSYRATRQPPQDEIPGGVMRRLAGVSAIVKRGSNLHESYARASMAGAVKKQKLQSDPRPDACSGTASSCPQNNSRPRGVFTSGASSGLLRKTERNVTAGHTKNTELGPVTVASVSSDEVAANVRGNTTATSSETVQQGYQANVAQKGLLTVVDPDHGATLRTSWSIDESEGLGKVEFGVSLEYNAVWFLPPADADCVGVLRYRIVPHPLLAPRGGWVSERGRLRDDPYIIVKATSVSPRSFPIQASPEEAHRALNSSKRQKNSQEAARSKAEMDQRRSKKSNYFRQGYNTHHEQSRQSEKPASMRRAQAVHGGRHAPAAAPNGHKVQPRTPIDHSRHVEWRPPQQESHGQHRKVATGLCRTHSKSPALPGVASGKELFPLRMDPSAKLLDISDTSDKVKCPVCHRGMDHWKSGQRQQHVHVCLLKQPSSAKKVSSASTTSRENQTTTPVRGGESATQLRELAKGASRSTGPTPPRGSLQPSHDLVRGGAVESRLSGWDERLPPPAESPRSTRVSLQGVFSPNREPDRFDRSGKGPKKPGLHSDGVSSTNRAVSRSDAPPKMKSTAPLYKAGGGVEQSKKSNGISVSRGMISSVPGVEVPSTKTVASNSPSQCPVCRLHFAGRQGQWERQAHIQQCLESLEGVFDSEE